MTRLGSESLVSCTHTLGLSSVHSLSWEVLPQYKHMATNSRTALGICATPSLKPHVEQNRVRRYPRTARNSSSPPYFLASLAFCNSAFRTAALEFRLPPSFGPLRMSSFLGWRVVRAGSFFFFCRRAARSSRYWRLNCSASRSSAAPSTTSPASAVDEDGTGSPYTSTRTTDLARKMDKLGRGRGHPGVKGAKEKPTSVLVEKVFDESVSLNVVAGAPVAWPPRLPVLAEPFLLEAAVLVSR